MVDSSLDEDAAPTVRSSSRQPLPSAEEREAALAVLGADPELGPKLDAGDLLVYRPMPPLAGAERPDGTVERTITVGLRPTMVRLVTKSSVFTWVAARWCASRAARPRGPSPGTASVVCRTRTRRR